MKPFLETSLSDTLENHPDLYVSHKTDPNHLWLETQLIELEKFLRTHFSSDLDAYVKEVLIYLAELTGAYQGVFFVLNKDSGKYEARAGYACLVDKMVQKEYEPGEGLIGQAALSQKNYFFENLPPDSTRISFSGFDISISSVLILCLPTNNGVVGLIEFLFFENLDHKIYDLLNRAQRSLAFSLESIFGYLENQRLAREANAQKEIVYSQKEELQQKLQEIMAIQEMLESQKNQTEKAYKDIKASNARIQKSLQYAKKFQNLILPNEMTMKRAFEDYFIVYRPRDEVSGDFYWFAGGEMIIIAVLDCTGHGVPGAFMSMIGNTLMNDIVNVKKIKSPAEILRQLHLGIRHTLRQEETANEDGMEASICCLEYRVNERVKLTYAGAKLSVYYRNNSELKGLKGDRYHLGGVRVFRNDLDFKNQVINLNNGDEIFLYSDGILDQCNDKRKKFGKKRLESILEKSAGNTMAAQKEIILKHFDEFTNQEEQRDDITLIGLKV